MSLNLTPRAMRPLVSGELCVRHQTECANMPIRSKILEGIIYTEISGELNSPLVIQHIDFIVSCKDKLENHYELHDFTNVKRINISSDEMGRITSYGMQTANVFKHSYIAIYANTDLAFGMARMFEISMELSKNPTIIKIFRKKDNAIQFLRNEMKKNG